MCTPTVLDLFCGAGGFSLGAYSAGFDVVGSVDIDEKLTSSYKNNFPLANLMIADISKLRAATLREKIEIPQTVDGLIGGPPCQGFSMIGKRNLADPRNELLRHFFRLVDEIRPRFFIMENVPGLVAGSSKSTLNKALSSVGNYEVVGPLCLDAYDFGAATRRRRVVLIGYDPARVEKISTEEIELLTQGTKSTVQDAISDLPEPTSKGVSVYRSSKSLSNYARKARAMPRIGLGSSEARARIRSGQVDGVQGTMHTEAVRKRFGKVAQGSTDTVSRCVRLRWASAAPTLRAGTGPDKGSFQAVRPLHPRSARVITVREAARLQGFPDWFEFHKTKWHSFRMIGNSVSPIMAEALLAFIATKLK